MEHDLTWLKSMIATRTQKVWEDEKRPYYISFIAIDAAKEGVDYKALIKPLKIRQWALTNEIDGLKLVEHPRHKAKVGYVPSDSGFTFDDVEPASEAVVETLATAATTESDKTSSPRANFFYGHVKTRRATLQFLETLSKLADDELDKVIIPVRTIVRLLNG